MARVVNKAQIKEAVKDCHISHNFTDALDAKVREIISAAEARAKANNRRTVMPKDL